MILCDLTTFSREVICSDNSLKVKVSSKNVTSRCEIKNKSLFFFFHEFLLVLKKLLANHKPNSIVICGGLSMIKMCFGLQSS